MSTRNTRNSRKARNARTILSLEHFTSKEQQKNLNESLKIAEKYNVNDSYLDNYQHRCHHLDVAGRQANDAPHGRTHEASRGRQDPPCPLRDMWD